MLWWMRARMTTPYRMNRGKNECSVDGCDAPFRCSGYCVRHYNLFLKWGSPDGAPLKPKKTCADCPKPIAKVSTRCKECSFRHRRKTARNTRRVTDEGYVMVSGMHGHPNAHSRGHMYEHTLVMSNILGRPLLPGENVHHKNGVRGDNRPENLELWVISQPAGQRAEDLVAWAHEILRRYA